MRTNLRMDNYMNRINQHRKRIVISDQCSVSKNKNFPTESIKLIRSEGSIHCRNACNRNSDCFLNNQTNFSNLFKRYCSELKELKDYFDVKYSRLKVLEEKINDLFTEDRSFDVYHSCRSRDLESKEKNCFENNNCYSYCGNSNEYPRKKTDLLIQNDDDDDDDDDDDNVDNNPNNPNGNKTNDSNSLMFEPIINIQIKDEINEEFVEEVEEQEEEDEDNGLEEVEKEVIENDGNNKDDGILAKKIYTGRRNFSTENQTKIVNNQSDVSNESMKITPIKTLVGKKLAANIHTKNEFMQMIQRCKQERSLTKEKISANVYMLRCSDDNSILGYQCSIDDCSYMHFLRAQVNRHFKNFHSKICSHCNQRFRRPYELSLHLKEIGRKQQSQLE